MTECKTATPNILGNYWENPAFRPIVDNSLVLWMTSDFGDSGTWTDLSGRGNHGTIYNATRTPLHPLGIFGSALDFDGINSYIGCGININPTDAVTIETWVNILEDATTHRYIIGKRGSFDLRQHSSNQLRFYIYAADGTMQSANILSSNWSKDIWYHLVGTFDKDLPSDNLKIYLNGVLKDTSNEIEDIQSTPYRVQIGYVAEDYLNATIAENRIYNRMLYAPEIMHNYTHSPIYYMQRELI